MNFKYTSNTKCLINGKEETIRLMNGCSGIGSREFWINEKKQNSNLFLVSDYITKENNFIYYGYWGTRPWDDCYFLVPESEADFFLTYMSKQDVYKQPVRAFVKNTWLSTKE